MKAEKMGKIHSKYIEKLIKTPKIPCFLQNINM